MQKDGDVYDCIKDGDWAGGGGGGGGREYSRKYQRGQESCKLRNIFKKCVLLVARKTIKGTEIKMR